MPKVLPLNETNITAYYDEDKHIFFVSYRENLTADTTNKAYAWLLQSGVPIEDVRAFIFDFTAVSKFRRDNTFASKRQSQTVNAVVDLSRIPVALIVDTIYQEQMVVLSLKVNGGEERTKICKSHAIAMTFIDQFHQKLAKRDAAETQKATTD